MNYATLLLLTQQYVENDEQSFVDNIPNFVRLAEERIYRYVKVPGLRTTSSPTITPSSRNITLPSDFVSADSFEINFDGTWVHLTPKDFDFLSQAYPTAATGEPGYYAQFDNANIIVAPTPGTAYTTRLTYTKKPASIVTAGTTWVGDNAEEALLYGTLVEAYTYLKGEPDLLGLYEQRFMEAIGQAKQLGDGKTRTDEWRNAPPLAL
jgi:hypothetical protein